MSITTAALDFIHGIIVPLANLAEEELAVLADPADAFREHYPALTTWLAELAAFEGHRREHGDGAFPDPPEFWVMPSDQLAACLRGCVALQRAVLTEKLRDVADGMLALVLIFVCQRLGQRASAIVN